MIHKGRVPAGLLVFNLDFCKIFVFMGGEENLLSGQKMISLLVH
jgi:hypothetical protein